MGSEDDVVVANTVLPTLAHRNPPAVLSLSSHLSFPRSLALSLALPPPATPRPPPQRNFPPKQPLLAHSLPFSHCNLSASAKCRRTTTNDDDSKTDPIEKRGRRNGKKQTTTHSTFCFHNTRLEEKRGTGQRTTTPRVKVNWGRPGQN